MVAGEGGGGIQGVVGRRHEEVREAKSMKKQKRRNGKAAEEEEGARADEGVNKPKQRKPLKQHAAKEEEDKPKEKQKGERKETLGHVSSEAPSPGEDLATSSIGKRRMRAKLGLT